MKATSTEEVEVHGASQGVRIRFSKDCSITVSPGGILPHLATVFSTGYSQWNSGQTWCLRHDNQLVISPKVSQQLNTREGLFGKSPTELGKSSVDTTGSKEPQAWSPVGYCAQPQKWELWSSSVYPKTVYSRQGCFTGCRVVGYPFVLILHALLLRCSFHCPNNYSYTSQF